MKSILSTLKTLPIVTMLLASQLADAQYTATRAFSQLPAFTKPIEMTFPDDGTNRLFLVQQRGVINVFPNNQTVTTTKVFLDISDSVYATANEMGLLGIAFHPNYKQNGYFYLNYSRQINNSLYTYVARYTVNSSNPDVADKSSKKILLKFIQPYSNHNGGCMRFGADGYLYISQGDGGSSNDPGNNAQSLGTFLGKILRIDVNKEENGKPYAIPSDNPFVTTPNAYPEIYAYGLRNPWKMQFDPVTKLLWAGDVGQNYREEIDIIEKGKNYGWKVAEGFSCRGGVNPCNKTGFQNPVIEYIYGNDGNYSITGGEVYRGSAMPELVGKYIFGDYSSARIYALDYKVGVDTSYVQLVKGSGFTISAFAHDQAGEIYIMGHSTGFIFKLGKTGTTGIESTSNNLDVQITSLFPNPVLNSFTIEFNKKQEGNTKIRLKNNLGAIVSTISDSDLPSGSNVLTFDLPKIENGMYFVEIETAQSKQVMKLVKE